MDMTQSDSQRVSESRLFLLAATLFVFIVLIGFARTYYLKGLFGTPPLASILVHVHGLVMTAWVALVAIQVWLIRSQRVVVHRKVGLVGACLAVVVVVVGFFTAISAAKNGSASFPPDIPPLAFLAVPLFDLLMMVLFVGAALYYRQHRDTHKRLMLLAVVNLLPPALARVPLPRLVALGPFFFFGVPALFALIALGYDKWRSGRVNRALALGTVLLIASYPVRLMVSGTEAWMRFARWLTTFALV